MDLAFGVDSIMIRALLLFLVFVGCADIDIISAPPIPEDTPIDPPSPTNVVKYVEFDFSQNPPLGDSVVFWYRTMPLDGLNEAKNVTVVLDSGRTIIAVALDRKGTDWWFNFDNGERALNRLNLVTVVFDLADDPDFTVCKSFQYIDRKLDDLIGTRQDTLANEAVTKGDRGCNWVEKGYKWIRDARGG